MTENIKLHPDQRVTTMTIARPEKRNAITQDMYAAMADALEDYAQSDAVRAFVITGAEDYFTSGNDLQDFAKGTRSDGVPPVIRFLTAISTCPKPLIAAVNGPAGHWCRGDDAAALRPDYRRRHCHIQHAICPTGTGARGRLLAFAARHRRLGRGERYVAGQSRS